MTLASIKNHTQPLDVKAGLLDGWAKKALLRVMSQLKLGHLTLVDGDNLYEFGQKSADATLTARVTIQHSSAYTDIIRDMGVGAGEAYIKGTWTTPDLVSVIRVLAQNLDLVANVGRNSLLTKRLKNIANMILRANSIKGAKRNIAAHYDLSNTFFSLMLDDTMMYSSAIFPDKSASLLEASHYKLESICQQLALKPSDHLVEIGTGWGGMAIFAATHYGCRVTTTTISNEQYEYAANAVQEAGVSHLVTVLKQDYRELSGQFDKLVSVEMIEAVGHSHYDTYFKKCNDLLKDNGLMLIQAITIPDQRYLAAKNDVDFIQRYIFPGGCLPAHGVMLECVKTQSDMQLINFTEIGHHYATTLNRWRTAFFNQIDAVKQLGFDDKFCRMWEFYLCYCEAGFRERTIGTGHFLFAKPQYQLV